MKKHLYPFIALFLLLLTLCSCQGDLQGPYVSTPQDNMLFWEKDGKVFLSNVTASAFTQVGEGGSLMNKTAVAMPSGSVYYLRDNTLWYKSYLEPEQKSADDVSSVFFAVGSVFAATEDGGLLRTGDDYSVTRVMDGIDWSSQYAPFADCGTEAYIAAQDGLYRLVMGDNPECILKADEVCFLNCYIGHVVFWADGSVYDMKSVGLKPRKLSGDNKVLPLPLELRTAYRNEIFWLEDDKLVLYNLQKGKAHTIATGLTAPKGQLLPKGASLTQALIISDGEKQFAYMLQEEKTVTLEKADWVYATQGILYGFREDALLRTQGETTDTLAIDAHHPLATPDGYYFLSGSQEGCQADLWALTADQPKRIATGVCGGTAPRAVYKYGGISYFTADSIYIMDEKTLQSDLFASVEGVKDFVPRKGGALMLLENGNLELMIYADSRSIPLSDHVQAISPFIYMPERLMTFPLQ